MKVDTSIKFEFEQTGAFFFEDSNGNLHRLVIYSRKKAVDQSKKLRERIKNKI